MNEEQAVSPPSISNVLIFMVDALRWDYLPESVRTEGLTVQTVATSLTTHTSVPSMLSGLHPHRHGVMSWQDRMPEIRDLLNLDGYQSAFFQAGEDAESDGIFDVLGIERKRPLDSIIDDEGWVYFERHQGGHVPFKPWSEFEGSFGDVVDKYAGNSSAHQKDYATAIEDAVEDFEQRLAELESAGKREDTLVILTSDHGEYLGEDGFVGHSSPLRPEGVYVPTVFFHPDLQTGRKLDGIMGHVDLFPTVLAALEEPIPDHVDGRPIWANRPSTRYAISVGNLYARGKARQIWKESSIWCANGGHAFAEVGVTRRLLTVLHNLFRNDWSSSHLRRERSLDAMWSVTSTYMASKRTYGAPDLDVDEARELIEEIQSREPVADGKVTEFRKETQEHLEDLGYL